MMMPKVPATIALMSSASRMYGIAAPVLPDLSSYCTGMAFMKMPPA